mgnify:CR=1 FL=1
MEKTPTRFKVWHVPQIPCKAFEVEVASPEEGWKLCETLALYDIFQLENNIKPDFANVNGLSYLDADGEWYDLDENEEYWREELEGYTW